MADTFLTLKQMEDLFQPVIVSILGWDVLSPSLENNVRIAWMRSGAPAIDINENYVYLRVMEVDNSYNRQREYQLSNEGDDLVSKVGYTRVISLNCVLYGENSFDNAQIVRDGMFSKSVRDTLGEQFIFLIPDIVAPKRIPEPFQGQWWERCDVEFRFNELIIRETAVNAVGSVEVEVNRENGDVDTFIVN
jgi:hypothetical protein